MNLILGADIPTLEELVSRNYGFHGDAFVIGLLWAGWVVLNLWIWQKTKAQSNLLMLCGSGLLAITYLIRAISWHQPGSWADIVGLGLVSAGFFMSVKPLVEGHLSALKNKLGGGKGGGGGSATPPSA